MMKTKETPAERFKRSATSRTNAVLNRLKILGNCANRQLYKYSEEDVDKIFEAIEGQVDEIRTKFYFPKKKEFKL